MELEFDYIQLGLGFEKVWRVIERRDENELREGGREGVGSSMEGVKISLLCPV